MGAEKRNVPQSMKQWFERTRRRCRTSYRPYWIEGSRDGAEIYRAARDRGGDVRLTASEMNRYQ